MLTIDGSQGEGGGQMLRSSLALSLITGTPFRMVGVRARRQKPGLQRQHLAALRAAVEIGRADVAGDTIGSREIVFQPGRVAAGRYHFDVASAGSTTLVLQTVLPALLAAAGTSSLTIDGGTHNTFAPPYDFLAGAFLPLLRRMGAAVELRLERPGFAPGGGGRISADVKPGPLAELLLTERGAIVERRARAMVASLPRAIAERELAIVRRDLGWEDATLSVEETRQARGPGNVLLLELRSEHVTEVFTGHGRRGVPAERVAREAVDEALAYVAAGVPVGLHLADQLMLPCALAGGGAYRTLPLTPHSLTNAGVIRRFLPIEVVARSDGTGVIMEIRPAA